MKAMKNYILTHTHRDRGLVVVDAASGWITKFLKFNSNRDRLLWRNWLAHGSNNPKVVSSSLARSLAFLLFTSAF